MSTTSPVISARNMRDLNNGLQQQMFFWGQDILHPQGNILVSQGFKRSPSTGLKGTSCYRLEWKGGHIELYGSCAGWYDEKGGFTFIRPKRRCVIWNSAETPIPGVWQREYIERKPSRSDLYEASLPFLDWLISYEETILANYGLPYREATYERYRSIPKAQEWIDPLSALKWFRCFRETPEDLTATSVKPKPKTMGGLAWA